MTSKWLTLLAEHQIGQETDIEKDTSFSRAEFLTDCLFLSVTFLLSIWPYILGLGFYSDDWGFLARMHTAPDSSFPGLLRELYVGDLLLRQRPVQVLLLAMFYSLFGLAPLGYHLINSLSLLTALLLLYAILRELDQSRLVALSLPLVYGLLPNYATDRFWLAAFQATFSMSFYFLSLYADLKALDAIVKLPSSSFWWKLVSLASLLLSVLAYEVVLPLFLLSPLLHWYKARQRLGRDAGTRLIAKHWPCLMASNFLILFAAVAYKLLVSVRVGAGVEDGIFSHLSFLIFGALRVNYGTYGVALPYILWWILQSAPQIEIIVTAIITTVIVMLYLLHVARQTENDLRQERWGRLILLSFAVFGLGYAIFLVNGDVWFTSAAVGNRVAIAATVGVAMTYVGFIGWCSSRLSRHQGGLFVILVALLCFSGFLISNVLGNFWVKAYQEELRILAAIEEEFPSLAQGSTLLLDGVCPEIGAAIVFNGPVDLGGAVATRYEDPTLRANRVTPELTIDSAGVTIGTFRRETFYPYNEDLWVFHYPKRTVTPLPNEAAAQAYFRNFQGDAACPPGFSWGWSSP